MFKMFLLWCLIKIWGKSNGLLIVLYQKDLTKDSDWIHCSVATKAEIESGSACGQLAIIC